MARNEAPVGRVVRLRNDELQDIEEWFGFWFVFGLVFGLFLVCFFGFCLFLVFVFVCWLVG